MGVLIIPTITTLQRTAITPDVGELMYDTDTGEIYKGDGTTAGGIIITGSGSGIPTIVSSTDNAITRWNGTGGDAVQDSAVTIDDSGNLSGVNNKTGADNDFVSGTSGTSGNLAQWNGDGDLVDAEVQAAAIADFITETDVINTLRSYSKPQWLDVATLTAVSDVFTPNLGVSGSFTADIGANSTLANPTIPSGYNTGKVLAWDITFTITGAGGWTLAFGNQYFVDADVDIAAIISDNSTTGDVIQLFFQFKNNAISVQPFIPTAIP